MLHSLKKTERFLQISNHTNLIPCSSSSGESCYTYVGGGAILMCKNTERILHMLEIIKTINCRTSLNQKNVNEPKKAVLKISVL